MVHRDVDLPLSSFPEGWAGQLPSHGPGAADPRALALPRQAANAAAADAGLGSMAASAGPSTANRSPAETAAAAGLASADGVSGTGGPSLLGAAGSGDLGECSFRPYESAVYFAAFTGHAAQRHMFSLHLSITIRNADSH